MFSVRQKREIADAVQKILRETNHPELPPTGEIAFTLHVHGAESWSSASIRNNAAVTNPGVNPHNEAMDPRSIDSPCTTASGVVEPRWAATTSPSRFRHHSH